MTEQTASWKSLVHQTSYLAYLPKAFVLNKGEIKLILNNEKNKFIADRCALQEACKEALRAEMNGGGQLNALDKNTKSTRKDNFTSKRILKGVLVFLRPTQ